MVTRADRQGRTGVRAHDEQRANRVDAQFERLFGLIATSETRPRQSRPDHSYSPQWTAIQLGN